MKRFFGWIIKGLLILLLLALAWIVLYAFLPPPTTITMATDPAGVKREWVSLNDISPNMVRAVIASEDGNFCKHDGFDREAIKRAWAENAKGGRVRGGSSISQQTAKNVFLWQDGGFLRKGLEAAFTVGIETIWGKRRIMEMYLNVAETGIGTYGVEAAAQRYFHKSAKDLTPSEAARIAANLPQPKKRAVVNPSGWLRRHGDRVARDIGNVKAAGLDNCIYD